MRPAEEPPGAAARLPGAAVRPLSERGESRQENREESRDAAVPRARFLPAAAAVLLLVSAGWSVGWSAGCARQGENGKGENGKGENGKGANEKGADEKSDPSPDGTDPAAALRARFFADFVPVTDAVLQAPAPEDWPSWRRTPDGRGYSPLARITTGNVGDLRMVWSRGMGPGSQQATPLAYRGVLYVPNPRDLVEALDAATGDLLWEYARDLPDDTPRRGRATTNRNLAIYGDRIFDTGGDGFLFALDAGSGRLAWETRIPGIHGALHTSGPIIAGGLVVSGRSCPARGSPEACVVVAHDARTGEERWRRRLIPGPGEPGDETWGGVPFRERRHIGAWMPPSYDPDLRLLYLGTSVTAPAPKFLLGGVGPAYLYENSTLALDIGSGEIAWHYQHLNDHWDFDHAFERMLVDTAVAPDAETVDWINPRIESGAVRRVLTGIPGKTGVVYTLDRETGEFLWAKPTVFQNVIADLDGATGEVFENPEVVFGALDEEAVLVCPGIFGGKGWEAGAYSPLTNAMYLPVRNGCARMRATRGGSHPGYALDARHEFAPGTTDLGAIHAISAETGRPLWIHRQRAATTSLVATGGGLVFGGDVAGGFRAFDQDTGAVLWETRLGAPVTGFPITYAVAGRQYVAVGTGAAANASDALRLTPELRPSASNQFFVFALPDRAEPPG